MANKHLTAHCEFECVPVPDLMDGIVTLKGRFGTGIIVPPPGDGPDNPLAWAIQDVSQASQGSDLEEQKRLCTNAVINARRALGCLVDWYVERDLGKFCKDPPTSPKQQSEFLMRRGVIDGLTSRVLARAIDKRNRVEHDFIAPDLETAEDVVELLRRTMASMRNHSDPSFGPWIFGIVLGEHGYGTNGRYAKFGGWSEPLVVFSRFRPRPWVGLVIPEDECRAMVRRAYLSDITSDQLAELLATAEQKYGHASSGADQESCEVMATELTLTQAD